MLSSSNYWPSYPKKSKSLTSRLVLLLWVLIPYFIVFQFCIP